MLSQEAPHRRFRRAIRDRHVTRAALAAQEIGELSLADALEFCLLLADVDRDQFSRAIARWHARFVLEAIGISAHESSLALSAAQGVAVTRTRELASKTLRHLANAYGLDSVCPP